MPSSKRTTSQLNRSRHKHRKIDKSKTDKYPNIYTGKSLFLKILKQCGAVLMNGSGSNVLEKDQSVFLKDFLKTIKQHEDYPDVVEDLMDGIKKYMDDRQRFIRMMLTTSFVEEESSIAQRTVQDSVMRLLLKTQPLHQVVAELLVDKLSDYKENSSLQLEGDTFGEQHETINVPQLILNQLRWLDAIDNSDAIAIKLLSTASIMPYQSACAIVSSLPEIVGDEVHNKVAVGLKELLSSNVELTIAILDTLCCLNCSENTMSDVKQTIFSCLRSVKIEELPVVVKYLLQTMNSDNAEESIACLREHLTFSPIALSQNSQSQSKHGSEETSVRLTAEAILYAAQYQPFVADSWIKILKKVKETELTSSDVVSLVLLCANYNATMKKSAIALMKMKLQSGVISDSLLELTFKECSHVLIPYFATLSDLATQFVGASISSLQHAGSVFYACMFANLDNYCRQEVIGCLVQHVGSFSASEADVALAILKSLAVDNLALLTPFTLFIRGILDHVNRITGHQIRLVYEVLSRLAFVKTEARTPAIEDELHMLIRKQLTHTSSTFRYIGVIGAVNMLNVLSQEENCDEKAYKTAVSILNLLEDTTISDNKTRAYYLDELSFMLQAEFDSRIAKRLHKTFKKEMNTKFLDAKDLKTSTQETSMKPLFSLAENENEMTGIPIFQASRASDSRISLLCPLFKAITDTWESSKMSNLAMCPVLLHSALNVQEFKLLGINEQKMLLDSLFVSLNWFREHINTFSKKRDEFCHALSRINHIIKLEGILETLVPVVQRYSPPIAILDFNQSDSQILEGGSTSSTQDEPDLNLSNHSAEDTCNRSATVTKKSKSSKKKSEVTFNARALKTQHLRELDVHVLNLIEVPLGEDVFDVNVNAVDSQEHNQIFPKQLLYLLQGLKRKITYKLQNADKKANPFSTAPTHIGFEKLDRVPVAIFVRKLCDLLPHLCNHLESVSAPLQEDGIDELEKESCDLLILCSEILVEVILSIISWKGVKSDNTLLKTILYSIGKRICSDVTEDSTTNHLLKIAFSYVKNFEDTVAKASMTCATSFTKLLSELAKLDKDGEMNFNIELNAFTIAMLKTEWASSSGMSSIAGAKKNEIIGYLVKMNLQTSDDVMKSVGHFVDEALCKIGNHEMEDLIYPCFQKTNIHVLFASLLDVLANKISKIPGIKPKTADSESIELLLQWNDCMKVVSVVMRLLRDFHSRNNIIASLKYGRNIIENFIKTGMPICEKMFHLYQDDVLNVLKYLQVTTRQLQHLTCHSKVTKDLVFAKQVPLLKKILETLLFRVKGMLAFHNCQEAFWLGNLKNRNIQGEEILSQMTQQENSEEEDSANITSYPDMSYSESY